MAHLTPSSRRGPQGTCHSHIKALGNALFVCVRGILSCLFRGSHSVDTATGCHCAYVGLVFQVKLSFNLNWNWEWQRQGSAQAQALSSVLSHHSVVKRAHIMNPVTATTAPISPQHSVHIDCRLWVQEHACVRACVCYVCVHARAGSPFSSEGARESCYSLTD